ANDCQQMRVSVFVVQDRCPGWHRGPGIDKRDLSDAGTPDDGRRGPPARPRRQLGDAELEHLKWILRTGLSRLSWFCRGGAFHELDHRLDPGFVVVQARAKRIVRRGAASLDELGLAFVAELI